MFAHYSHNLLAKKMYTLLLAPKSAKGKKYAAWPKKWDKLPPYGAIKELGLKPSSNVKDMPELKLKKEVLKWLIVAKSSHSYFGDYHKRFENKKGEIQYKSG